MSAVPCALGQPLSADQILAQAVRVEAEQAALRSAYASHLHIELWSTNKDRSPRRRVSSSDFEVLFLEGAPYRRRVAVNGKPLKKKEAEQEEQRFQMTAAERRAHPPKNPGLSAGVEIERVARLMDHTLVREEKIDDRMTWVIASEPKPDARVESDGDRATVCYRTTYWIDQVELAIRRVEFEVIREGVDSARGSHYIVDFGRPAPDSPWQIVGGDALFRIGGGPWSRQRDTYSNFRRFSAESSVRFEEPNH